MNIALYRKYRSKSLSEIVGQNHITTVLGSAIKKGMVAHAYLLTGPRGVGKTSIARILAHEINQLPYEGEGAHLDVIEIDAASNNGVDDVRQLRENVNIAPVSAKKKVYIIDEVHMLSKPAFNALLKTLEEPPDHVVFILATTNDDKLPPTIISRTQHFKFKLIGAKDIASHLKTIAEKENISIDESALQLIAKRGGGSFRDSISLLDQVRSMSSDKTVIHKETIETMLGLATDSLISDIMQARKKGDVKKIVELVEESLNAGTESSMLASQLIDNLRQVIAEEPSLIPLLDALLEVDKSSRPDEKLLVTMASGLRSKQKTMPLASVAPEISAPLAKLSQQAEAVELVHAVPTDQRPADMTALPFDGPALLEQMRTTHVAIYSVLKKCSFIKHKEKLLIYTGSSFYKNKLDDVKYRKSLLEAIKQICDGTFEVETIGALPPLKDSQVAMVAAIMGGGEEISVDAAP